MASTPFSLDDRYTVVEGQICLSGVQALVRLPMDQHRRDRAAGLRVGTYISGYQGSPLGELDKQMRMAGHLLPEHDIVFQPGINEDVAATAIYGSQLLEQFPHERFQGVNGIWYGKAPGIDRTGDAFRHAQYIGTSRYGAALALGGDDPACKSSTIPSDSTMTFYDLFFPVLYPGDPQDVLELGLHGLAMSRYSGLWSAMKIVTNVADGGAILDVHPNLALPVIPELEIDGKPFAKVQDPRLIPPFTVEMERQIFYERLVAVRAYARANGLDKIVVRSGSDRLGLVAAGKTFKDLMQALHLLGFGDEDLRQAGIRVYKLGMIAPIEPHGLYEFADGLEEILVVEEKRGFSETLIREALYNRPRHPAVHGKYDADGKPLFPIHSEMGADQVASVLAGYLARRLNRPDLPERIKWISDIGQRSYEPVMPRTPFFCSGCPHNTSTRVLEGDLVGGGIGCHAMAMYMDRGVSWLTHMGGEGAPWMGLAPFTEKPHLFQNVGDGTYYHSASKALEACIASGVNMTYRLLYNRAVAMTGGQDVVGVRGPVEIAQKLVTEGASEVVIVPELLENYPKRRIGEKITVRPKIEYNQVLTELREKPGVTVLIFDQQCAAEKRRQRKRGLLATPRQRVVINESVCEGCGDCGVKSNCLSVVPVQTPYGRKTQIHQSSCNMDYSCLKGDCPSFMTIELAEGSQAARRKSLAVALPADLPEPAHKVTAERPYKTMLIGIGGTGVVTVDALLVTAALIERKYATHLDQTGLAQKGGAVLSNFTVSDAPIADSNKIAAGEADLCIAFDLLATVSADNLNRFHPERTVVVANTSQISTAEVVTDIHKRFPELERLQERLNRYTRRARNLYLNAAAIAEALFGDHMQANVFLVGVAYQLGLLPLRAGSIEAAIEANRVAIEQNKLAFRWGRKHVLDPDAVEKLIRGDSPPADPRAQALDKLRRHEPGLVAGYERLEARFPQGGRLGELLPPRVADLLLYQDEAYASQYLAFVARIGEGEQGRTAGRTALREAVAAWLFKLMAIKDEYEVARLWLQDPAWEQVLTQYDGAVKRFVHLHPPLFRRLGMQRKIKLGPWFFPMLRLLYRMRRLRGGALDAFNWSAHRRMERGLIGWYRELVEGLLGDLTHENHAVAVAIAEAPDGIRGYEEIKERTLGETRGSVAQLLERFQANKLRATAAQAGGD
jgi:indolepyruvate ferredoxin oxidoreductase